MENKFVAKLICGLAVGGLLLASGGLAIAGNTASGDTATSKPFFVKQNMMPSKGGFRPGNIEKVLQEQVSDAVITREQADQLLAWQQKQNEERKAQLDKIKAMTLKEEMKTQRENFRNMTEEERQALLAEKKDKKPGIFEEAVAQGIITREQADKINEAMRSRIDAKQPMLPETKLDSLVEQGAITSEQAEAIIKKMEEAIEQRQAAGQEKMKDLSQEERRQLKQEKRENPDLLGSLVDDGTLTQEQADAVIKILSPQKHGEKWPMGKKGPSAADNS